MQAATTYPKPGGEHAIEGPYGPFEQIRIGGYDPDGPGNIYYAAVKPNPFDDQRRTLIGLFPVNLGVGGLSNGDGVSFIGLSISCDGFFWGPFHRIVDSRSFDGRPADHPVDGFLVRGGISYLFVQRGIPGITKRERPNSRIEMFEMNRDVLQQLTKAAQGTLPGCSNP